MASVSFSIASLPLILALFVLQSVALQLDVDSTASIQSAAATIAFGLQSIYTGNQTGGVVGKFPFLPYYWWESGAAWGAMINYWHYTGDTSYNDVTYNALVSQISPTNDFMPQSEIADLGNDDQAFWALGAMSAAEFGFQEPPAPYPSWLTICENVFNDYVSRWEAQTCAGGLKWQIYSQNAGYTYKNSISNGGFFQLSARLARMTGNQTYVEWANKVWDWVEHVGLVDNKYNVFDGTDELINCTQLDHTQWTYNVGVYMYGAAMLQNVTNGQSVWVDRTNGLLQNAESIFSTPYSNSTKILYEAECEQKGNCNTDQLSMKGYLARWMAGTSQVAPFTAGRVGAILRASAVGAASSCSGLSNSTCGNKWYINSWDGTSGMGQQLSALETTYALLVNSTSPPKAYQSVSAAQISSSSSSKASSTIASTTSTKVLAHAATAASSTVVSSSTSLVSSSTILKTPSTSSTLIAVQTSKPVTSSTLKVVASVNSTSAVISSTTVLPAQTTKSSTHSSASTTSISSTSEEAILTASTTYPTDMPTSANLFASSTAEVPTTTAPTEIPTTTAEAATTQSSTMPVFFYNSSAASKTEVGMTYFVAALVGYFLTGF